MEKFLIQLAAEETAKEGGLAVLGINPMALLLQLITFVILYLILKRFAFKKIVALLEERRKTINEGIDLGHEMEVEKQRLNEKISQMINEARTEADKVIAAGHHEAGVIIKEAEDIASRKVDSMLADARVRIEEDIDNAREGLKTEVLSLVAEAAEVVIGEKLDAREDAEHIQKILNKSKV